MSKIIVTCTVVNDEGEAIDSEKWEKPIIEDKYDNVEMMAEDMSNDFADDINTFLNDVIQQTEDDEGDQDE